MSLVLERQGRLGLDVARLDSPGNRNALSLGLLGELIAAVEESGTDRDSRGLVLDHTGSVFCAGVDLRERQTLEPGDHRHSSLLAELLERLWAYPKPLLCRVDGHVRGGGMGLVACADIVVASARASFAYSEVKVGVAPALVGAVALLKVPLGQLIPWLMTGEAFTAHEAKDLGLVTQLAGDDDSRAVLQRAADAVLRAAPGACVATKSLARDITHSGADGLFAEMCRLSGQLFESEEAREGMAAFTEKREPAWVAPQVGSGSVANVQKETQ
jgi:enoyl-CoA hydratase/carnithine racemase